MELTSLDIKEPGLRILPPGVERYVVIGGGLSVFEIFPEDQIEIINNEGKQLLEIAVFNNKGKTDSSILNLKENGSANEIKKILSRKEESVQTAVYQLKKNKLDINKAKSSSIFDPECKAEEKIKIKSKDNCICIFATPGGPMNIENQNPPTDITIMVKRANPNKIKRDSFFLKPGIQIRVPINIDNILEDFENLNQRV